MSFVTNHDTDRNGATSTSGTRTARSTSWPTEWLLAQGYGSPQVYSSFTWTAAADSPPDRRHRRRA